MRARSVLRVVAWPFVVLGNAPAGFGRFMWYLFLPSNPLTIALWMMYHVDHHREEEKKS